MNLLCKIILLPAFAYSVSIFFVKCTNPPKNDHKVNKPYFGISYHTLFSHKNEIISYELHSDGEIQYCYGSYPLLNVIVNNPDSTDVKKNCHDIIKDVILINGNKRVIINIYDNYGAYKISKEIGAEYNVINDTDEQFMDNHKIAAYQYACEQGNEDSWAIVFYPEKSLYLSQDRETIKWE